MEPPKLKLLCLHGNLQNSEVFRSRLGSMRRRLKSRLEFEFVEGPYKAIPGSLPAVGNQPVGNAVEEQGLDNGLKSWWLRSESDVGADGRPCRAVHYSGWEPALERLLEAIRLHRPDGILGFSQGATATALLLSCLPKADLQGAPLPKFAIMIAGSLPSDTTFAEMVLGARPSTPSLFVFGTADALVPADRSRQMVKSFEPSSVTVYEHVGAHTVPACTGDFKQAMVAFLDGFAGQAGRVGVAGGAAGGRAARHVEGGGAREAGKGLAAAARGEAGGG